MSLFKGFRGIARIRRENGSYLLFRFTNADVGLTQDLNAFLPSYGGSDLYRIISPKVGDIGGRISLLLGSKVAHIFYEIAQTIEEVTLELVYRDGSARTYTGVKFNQLSFSCKAGEIIQVNIDLVAKTFEKTANDLKWVGTDKLVTWDKVGFTGVLPGEDAQSFTYSIENNLVTNRTAASLLPYDIREGIQKVSGSVVWFDSLSPRTETVSSRVNAMIITQATFWVDSFVETHHIAHHWTYRAPLSPDLLVTTLEWTKTSPV
jgi:hypothetical protein